MSDERVPLEQRVHNLALQALHELAHLVTTTDKDEVDELESDLQNTLQRLCALTRDDPEEMLKDLHEIVEKHKQMIDEGLAEDAQAAMIIAGVREDGDFQVLVVEMQNDADAARQEAADNMDGQSRDGTQEGGEVEEDSDPSGKVDPDVLSNLSTVSAN
jgi:hypothetical protein